MIAIGIAILFISWALDCLWDAAYGLMQSMLAASQEQS